MRTNGILLAISSLPSNYGIGDFGKNACTFIKYLEKANIKIWQILPINPLGYGNSPYQSIAGNAIDPIYISLDYLKTQGYIHSKLENVNSNSLRVDYDIVRKHKEKYLFEAYKNSNDKNEVDKFLKKNKWCKEYSRFQILLKKNSFDNWWKRDKNERYAHYNNFDYSPYIKEIDYLEWLQYIAYKQFGTLKAFAKEHGVKIMGDIPFYVGGMSSDMWANQDDFLLDENDIPTDVAGVPPDYFSATGQRWGNPIYDWEVMKEDNFNFLISRIKNAANLYDLLRIDHFRAFDTYYKIPSESETAIEGSWEKAYGNEFFDNFFSSKIKIKIFAEDLGNLIPSVLELRDKYNLIGMNVLEFTILDENFKTIRNQIIYTATHDNNTIVGWYNELNVDDKERIKNIFNKNKIKSRKISDRFVEYALKSKAQYAIIPMQDYLGLDSFYRMNTPGTCGSPNWQFRINSFDKFARRIPFIRKLIKEAKR